MPPIMTVTGPIAPDDLGFTYAHEHLLGGPPEWSPEAAGPDFLMLSTGLAARELGLFKPAVGSVEWAQVLRGVHASLPATLCLLRRGLH